MCVRRPIQEALLAGAKLWAVAISTEIKQGAFTTLTERLRAQRGRAIALCDSVAKWQALKVEQTYGGPDVAKRKGTLPVLGTPSGSRTPSGFNTPILPSTRDQSSRKFWRA